MKPPLLLMVAALLATQAYAFAPGGTAYTKRVSTVLLAEPAPLAQPVGRLANARKLTIAEVRGAWVRVSDGNATGWVFAGNLAEQKPVENSLSDKIALNASETSASAAARPLAPAAADYADRRGLEQARNDVEWLEQTSDAITAGDVQAYKQAQKKGEFQ